MTRDEQIIAIMDKLTWGTTVDMAMLQGASDRFIELLHGQVEVLNKTSPCRDEDVAEDTAYGRLLGRPDSMPGITLEAMFSSKISYRMSSIWIVDAILPATLVVAAVGRPIGGVVALPVETPRELAAAEVQKVNNLGSKRVGHNVRIDLKLPLWSPKGFITR